MIRSLFLLCLMGCLVPAAAAEVRIVPTATGFQLQRDGKPYFVLGAGGTSHMDKLPAAGANSIRTWGPPTKEQMDQADKLGLTVLLGLPAGKPRHSFNYANEAAVQKQRERTRQLVRQYKDHPALLMWALGNETEHQAGDAARMAVWKEFEVLAKIVKEEDPHHPVITVLAGTGRQHLVELTEHIPSLDAVGINTYGGMLRVVENIATQGWKKPWLITEFGPRGHWEVDKTPWGMPIEDTSTEKAEFYLKAYQQAIRRETACLGSYVFLWGQKQEKTHTWYGMFLPDGQMLTPVDAMTEGWTGAKPANQAPRTSRISIEGVEASGRGWARVKTGQKLKFSVEAKDADGDKLAITWDLRKDVADNPNTGGDREESVAPIPGAIDGSILNVPAEPGNYRLFVYVSDGKGKAATANVALQAAPSRE